MDLIVRYEEDGTIQTRYYSSVFLTSCKASDLYEGFSIALGENLYKIIHISMDGPNVNWKMLEVFKEDNYKTPEHPAMIEFGSSTIHVILINNQCDINAFFIEVF